MVSLGTSTGGGLPTFYWQRSLAFQSLGGEKQGKSQRVLLSAQLCERTSAELLTFCSCFNGACGPKGEVWLHLESCPQRGMAGVGVRRVAGLQSWRRKVGSLGDMPAGA